jgi:hypothetical protein
VPAAKRSTQEVFVYPNDVIKTARIEHPKSMGASKILIRVDGKDGEHLLLEYYKDEISFSSEELVGKTVTQARQMHFDKDKSYLQS